MNLKNWIFATRLYTLPLSIYGISLSFFLSTHSIMEMYKCLKTYVFSILTALSLQILANFSNDYGDSIKLIFHDNEMSMKKKFVYEGIISSKQMKKAIFILFILSFILGFILIYPILYENIIIFFTYLIGLIFCILSAIKYSCGNNPYGWKWGMGDLSVFLFFGIFSVLGSFFLYNRLVPSFQVILLSISMGFLNTAILNINNMRDLYEDSINRKETIVVRFGLNFAKWYHFVMILNAILLGFLFISMKNNIYQLFSLSIVSVLLIMHCRNIMLINNNKFLLHLELKKLVFLIFLYVLSIGMQNYL
ncbi:1,4-dihydroxy-2-naphthoate octaprenyltransferase [Blattabacterium cuenoti]|uniref:1,4-dihydroxy-2-naphthoate octaprenyltransferase n=1 Tax=Blattabacterium cuenoti TaxID=1653831 RepID=UPI00163C8001|nr:1,4-dihydroxy-2-naphthoate octaprenyltransferase [Blattabacterium cuenoti]